MSAIPQLTDEEKYLAAILDDPSGIELAEFAWVDEEQPDRCFRVWDFQYSWYACDETYQIDLCGRSVGKSNGILMRAFAFPFNFPGQEMLITAPELNHLRPITDKVEALFTGGTRLGQEMLVKRKGNGINHQPQFQAFFSNGARIISRLPNRDGKGVKGMHPLVIEADEMQDFPEAGWVEIIETMKAGSTGAQWRAHGVSRGVRDTYYKMTTGENPDLPFYVHRYMAPHRPTWSDEERRSKIAMYGGTEENVDYRRNIFGEHGDAHNPLFVLARLMACVRINESSWATEYNDNVYARIKINDELFRRSGLPIESFLEDIPRSHLDPQYVSYWAGMDVGFTNDPTEILVFGVLKRSGKPDLHRLLLRVQLQRIAALEQVAVMRHIFGFYGSRLKRFGMDKMQPVSEPVLTPAGWVPIGSIRVGDQVIGSDGRPTRVVGVYPQADRRVMKVTCSDGSWTRCGPEHLWTVQDRKTRRWITLTTEQLRLLRSAGGVRRWALPMLSGPARTQETSLPIHPYVLGALLGDGNLRDRSVRFASADQEIIDEVNRLLPNGFMLKYAGRYDYNLSSVDGSHKREANGRFIESNPVVTALRDMGLLGKKSRDKYIPAAYLTAAPHDRLALLQGLMDTDGHVNVQKNLKSTNVGMNTTSRQLAEGVVSLVESFGGSGRLRIQNTKNGEVYRVNISLPGDVMPFRLSRKADKVIPKIPERLQRYVDTIEEDGEEESVCIRVEADDHLYVTRHHILTHNTGNGLPLFQIMRDLPGGEKLLNRVAGYGFSQKLPVAFDDREMTGKERPEDLVIEKNVVDFATDELRKMVDTYSIELPYDTELLTEWQGQSITMVKDMATADGVRRKYSGGSCHSLDAGRMFAAAKGLEAIEAILNRPTRRGPVLDAFFG